MQVMITSYGMLRMSLDTLLEVRICMVLHGDRSFTSVNALLVTLSLMGEVHGY